MFEIIKSETTRTRKNLILCGFFIKVSNPALRGWS